MSVFQTPDAWVRKILFGSKSITATSAVSPKNPTVEGVVDTIFAVATPMQAMPSANDGAESGHQSSYFLNSYNADEDEEDRGSFEGSKAGTEPESGITVDDDGLDEDLNPCDKVKFGTSPEAASLSGTDVGNVSVPLAAQPMTKLFAHEEVTGASGDASEAKKDGNVETEFSLCTSRGTTVPLAAAAILPPVPPPIANLEAEGDIHINFAASSCETLVDEDATAAAAIQDDGLQDDHAMGDDAENPNIEEKVTDVEFDCEDDNGETVQPLDDSTESSVHVADTLAPPLQMPVVPPARKEQHSVQAITALATLAATMPSDRKGISDQRRIGEVDPVAEEDDALGSSSSSSGGGVAQWIKQRMFGIPAISRAPPELESTARGNDGGGDRATLSSDDNSSSDIDKAAEEGCNSDDGGTDEATEICTVMTNGAGGKKADTGVKDSAGKGGNGENEDNDESNQEGQSGGDEAGDHGYEDGGDDDTGSTSETSDKRDDQSENGYDEDDNDEEGEEGEEGDDVAAEMDVLVVRSKPMFGRPVRKNFGEDHGGWFDGVVTAYNFPYWEVTYLDGDKEDFTMKELDAVLEDAPEPNEKKPKQIEVHPHIKAEVSRKRLYSQRCDERGAGDESNLNKASQEQEETNGLAPFGRPVRKNFGEGHGGWFDGVVTAYKFPFWEVTYNDGDKEDLTVEELNDVLVDVSELKMKHVEVKHREAKVMRTPMSMMPSQHRADERHVGNDEGFGSDLDEASAEQVETDRAPYGRRVRKNFGEGHGGWFDGVVTAYKFPYWEVTYNNGDKEDLTVEELNYVLVDVSEPKHGEVKTDNKAKILRKRMSSQRADERYLGDDDEDDGSGSENSDKVSHDQTENDSGNSPAPCKKKQRSVRKVWTEEETRVLRKGVAKYGRDTNKWAKIKADIKFGKFLKDRTNVMLKDKWRNLTAN